MAHTEELEESDEPRKRSPTFSTTISTALCVQLSMGVGTAAITPVTSTIDSLGRLADQSDTDKGHKLVGELDHGLADDVVGSDDSLLEVSKHAISQQG